MPDASEFLIDVQILNPKPARVKTHLYQNFDENLHGYFAEQGFFS